MADLCDSGDVVLLTPQLDKEGNCRLEESQIVFAMSWLDDIKLYWILLEEKKELKVIKFKAILMLTQGLLSLK